MEKYYFSPSKSLLLPESLIDNYRSVGMWPDDAIPVSDDIYIEYGGTPAPAGKIMVTGEDGMPAWGDQPPPTPEEARTLAAAVKSSLLARATAAIAPLQDAADLDMATDDEQAQILAWKKYRVLLNRVDTSTAPDIEWPAAPGTKSDELAGS
ncbi:tail fiber protein [Salmonella enterica subsp. enterica serovar Choleraesuis]|nr:tail fiber protein [Salmonella enterica subsp. enterica serovar Choleraesuis]